MPKIQMPFPNYHAARVKSPSLFLRVRVMQTTKEGVMIYGGPLKSDPRGSTKTQAIRFPKDKYTVKEAKAWLKDHKQKYISFEPASEKKEKKTEPVWPSILGILKAENEEDSIEDYEYLFHHVVIDSKGKEEIHHCLVYDHVANMFELDHLIIKAGKVYLNGKNIKEGTFHILKGLESSQEVVWSDKEAFENKIKPKKMKSGMTLKEKAKEW